MSVRTDQIQLEIILDSKKAGKSYQDLLKVSRDLKRELLQLEPGTEAFVRKSAELGVVNRRLAEIKKTTNGIQTESSGVTSAFKKFLPALGVAAIVGGVVRIGQSLFALAKESLNFFNEQAKADAQLRSGIESTRGAANLSFEQLKQQAKELQSQTLFGDEQINQAQSILLTFTNIKDEIFNGTVPAILDMATKLNASDLQGSAIQIGKALNDPVLGVSALAEAGIQFSVVQKEMIKDLVEGGNTAEAQRIILKELETQFGGSAQAAAQAGNGSFTIFSNRVNDIKENIGLLINRGLKPLIPVFDSVVTFVEGFVDRMVTGNKATGQFSSGINGLYNVLKFLVQTGRLYLTVQSEIFQAISSVAVPLFDRLSNGFSVLIQYGEKLPFIGFVFEGISKTVSVLSDLLENTSATFDGFRAAGQQAVENIKQYFNGLVVSAKIVALQIEKALSIRQSEKDRLTAEIRSLQDLQVEAAQSGRTIGEAYAKARNESIAANRIVDEPSPSFVNPNLSVGNQATAPTTTVDPKIEIDRRLKAIEDSSQKELDLIKIQALKRQLTDQEFETLSLIEKENALQRKLDLLVSYGQTESDQYRKLQIEQLEIQRQISSVRGEAFRVGFDVDLLRQSAQIGRQAVESELKLINDAGDKELDLLKQKFLNKLLTEQEFETLSLLEKSLQAERKLEQLQAYGLTETEQFRKLQIEQLEIQRQYDQKKIDNAERTAQIKEDLQNQQRDQILKTLDLGISALGKDEDARKKYGGAIKAFEISKIGINLQAEIQGIWKNAKISLPEPFATALAVAQTGFAIGRAGASAKKIAQTKFFHGGYTGMKAIYHDGLAGVAGLVHIDEHVTPSWQLKDPESIPLVNQLEYIRRKKGGFRDGGFTTVQTEPTGLKDVPLSGDQSNDMIQALLTKFDTVVEAIATFPKSIKSHVVLTELQSSANELSEIQNLSNL